MAIRSSSATEVERLVARLSGDSPVERDAAIARLRVLGPRAVDRLVALLHANPDAAAKRVALSILEDIDDPRARQVLESQRIPQADPACPPTTDDPSAAREWLQEAGGRAALSDIHQLIVAMHERERAESSAKRRQAWQAARGAAHALLAGRDSRVALYDLRESFEETAAPLPADYVDAARRIGDAACVESLGLAWGAARDDWWRSSLSGAARAIVTRERLSARHAPIKRVRAKWPEFLP